MLETMFRGVFDTDMTRVITPGMFMLCLGCALAVGVLLALGYMYRTRYTKSFVMTLALLPAVVCVVIMMVNGNVGTGVAVAGAFSLVRFRSVPGTAREISMLFIAMGAGLIAGMGYLGYSVLFAAVMCLAVAVYNRLDLGAKKNAACYRTLTVTIPEDLSYTGVFEPVFENYTRSFTLVRVKTTNMGSLFRLTYDVTLKEPGVEKQLIDELRCRNGNLEISVSSQDTGVAEL